MLIVIPFPFCASAIRSTYIQTVFADEAPYSVYYAAVKSNSVHACVRGVYTNRFSRKNMKKFLKAEHRPPISGCGTELEDSLKILIPDLIGTIQEGVLKPLMILTDHRVPGKRGRHCPAPAKNNYSDCVTRVLRKASPSARVEELFEGIGDTLSGALETSEPVAISVSLGERAKICLSLKEAEAKITSWVRLQTGRPMITGASRQRLLDRLLGPSLQRQLGLVAVDHGFFLYEDLNIFISTLAGNYRRGEVWHANGSSVEDSVCINILQELREAFFEPLGDLDPLRKYVFGLLSNGAGSLPVALVEDDARLEKGSRSGNGDQEGSSRVGAALQEQLAQLIRDDREIPYKTRNLLHKVDEALSLLGATCQRARGESYKDLVSSLTIEESERLYLLEAFERWDRDFDQLSSAALVVAKTLEDLPRVLSGAAMAEDEKRQAVARRWKSRRVQFQGVDFPRYLRGLRSDLSLTQTELAERLKPLSDGMKISQAHISRWERGSIPSDAALVALERFENTISGPVPKESPFSTPSLPVASEPHLFSTLVS